MRAESMNRFILLMTFFTGMTGLIYEVTWQKYLSHLLGSQAKATALILSIFLAGLAVGYAAFGRISRGKSRIKLLELAAYCEIGIGVWAFAFPILFEYVWTQIGILPIEGPWTAASEWLICIILIAPPTILMGSTLPLLTQGLTSNLRDSSRLHTLIYSVNTGGAFLGCLLAGYYLIATYGLPLTMMFTSPVNILAGIGILAMARSCDEFLDSDQSSHPQPSPSSDESTVSSADLPEWLAMTIAFVAGFTGLQI